MGLEPTTFSLGSWNGLSKSRWTSAVRRRLGATSRDMRGQEWTPGAARTSADKSDRGLGDGAAGGPSAHLQTFGFTMGPYEHERAPRDRHSINIASEVMPEDKLINREIPIEGSSIRYSPGGLMTKTTWDQSGALNLAE
jgi:hypothetical protein